MVVVKGFLSLTEVNSSTPEWTVHHCINVEHLGVHVNVSKGKKGAKLIIDYLALDHRG